MITDRAQLALFANLSALAYENLATVRKFYPKAKLIEDERTDTQAYFFPKVKPIGKNVVAFRGTQISHGWSWDDIFTNARISQREWWGGGYVHRGYSEALDGVSDALRGCEPEIFTGHSLGGVLATGALLQPDMEHCEAVSFGAPAFGDAKTAALLAPRLTRVVMHHDIAPKHPRPTLPTITGGYRQPKPFLALAHDGTMKEATWRWWNYLYIPFTSFGALHGKADHKIGLYKAMVGGIDQ